MARGRDEGLFKCNSAISACKERSAWAEALVVLRRIRTLGFSPSGVSYAVALRSAAPREWEQGLAQCLCQLQAQRVQCNAIIASTALTTLGRGMAWRGSLELFGRMRIQELAQDTIAYTAAIATVEPLGRWQLMLELLAVMPSPDVVAYGSAVSACAKAGFWEGAAALLCEMSARRVRPNAVCLNSAITACGRGTKWLQALGLLELMADQVVRPDAVSFCALISACAVGAQWQVALGLLAAMPSRQLQQSEVGLNSAMSACEKAGQWQRAVDLMRGMGSQSLLPDAVTAGTAAMACDAADQWQRSILLQGAAGHQHASARCTPEELVELIFAAASAGAARPQLLAMVRSQLPEHLAAGRLPWRATARLAWALANLQVYDAQLLDALQEDLQQQVERCTCPTRAVDLESSGLAVLWACSFLGRLRQKARALVHTAAQRAAAPLDGRSVLALAPTATAAPLRVEMQELLVVNKPPHWQVDSTTERDSGASLGALLRGLFPQTRILRDAAHGRGLDVPSSGLLLVAKTYGCYFELRMQLQTGQLLRAARTEYAVLCHGLLPRARAVAARVAAPSAGRGDQSSVAPQGKAGDRWEVALTRSPDARLKASSRAHSAFAM
ncbi:unnamed protein product [Effrenium voratum]|uniref:Pentatricopeptide repeat-containing protein, chloroplastic n=1 Tax=Effrenium voratum TaxID=2562239 RepID=A0AA36I7W5_9DINO|nr:unnamed protein product [Effrenium voratum]